MRKRFYSVFLIAAVICCGKSSSQTSSKTTNPNTSNPNTSNPNDSNTTTSTVSDVGPTSRFLGRVVSALATSEGNLLTWPGTAFEFGFSGTSIDVNMQLSQPSYQIAYFNVMIDGNLQSAPIVVDANTTSVTITAPQSGNHAVSLIKRTEDSLGEVYVGLTGNYKLVNLPATPNFLIELVGDSITAGYGILSTSPSCSSSNFIADPNYEDVYVTAGVQTAMKLAADWSVVAYSGKGLVTNSDGSTDLTIPELYALNTPVSGSGNYLFSRPADVVVINAGYNDFSHAANSNTYPNSNTFIAAGSNLVSYVLSKNPNAYVILAVGPMYEGLTIGNSNVTQHDTALAYIQAIQAASNSSKVSVLDYGLNSNSEYGCDYHPNQTFEAGMATALLAKIAELTDR